MSKLQVVVLEAKGIPKVDPVGWSDPYVQVRLGDGKVVETKVRKNEKSPVWDKRFQFNVSNKKEVLHLRIMDSDHLSKDDPIGTMEIPLESINPDKPVFQWFPIKLAPKVKPDSIPCQLRLIVEFI
ncbi:C2 domain containing protein [Trichomonas vaginalis G3]|uniref:C2 domain containing protein n=1 Tax=Trichomonas vaginalis (strain ATCC PRA-98 / G3) TaxID=412133 RepID=A2EHX7_TRIV3|nr:C2 domain containing protein [Trichomonas vaginalis G3]|eukprot:XP_001319932.1 C2 domain containing protein [Trichomonas vaginalis G3]